MGAMYRGACPHTGLKAGGNEMAQLSVAEKGVATTSKKYTIAHSRGQSDCFQCGIRTLTYSCKLFYGTFWESPNTKTYIYNDNINSGSVTLLCRSFIVDA